MNAELLKLYADLRKHEQRCQLCRDPLKQHKCEERKRLQTCVTYHKLKPL